jgi:outer membrane protein
VIAAQRVLRAASDQLKTLMNDPELPVGSEMLILPADGAIDAPIQFSLVDSVNTAIAQRPEVQRAIISIDNTSVRLNLADNARLPQLNFRAQSRLSGLAGRTDEAYDAMTEARFVDYQLALQFEQAIGNRAAEAGYTQRRLERQQSLTAYRNTVQGIVQEVKSSLRDVATNYVLIGQRRVARYAAAENVRTLDKEMNLTTGLTPNLLDLQLRRQQALASAEQQEVSALIDYNTALARLHSATGTALTRNRIQFLVPDAAPAEPPISDLFPDYPVPVEDDK